MFCDGVSHGQMPGRMVGPRTGLPLVVSEEWVGASSNRRHKSESSFESHTQLLWLGFLLAPF